MRDASIGGIIGTITGFVLGTSIGLVTANSSARLIPRIEKVEQGYIAPSKLEIQCKDLDGNGIPETIMKIGNKSYLLREVNGKPVISEYKIKPVEVVPTIK